LISKTDTLSVNRSWEPEPSQSQEDKMEYKNSEITNKIMIYVKIFTIIVLFFVVLLGAFLPKSFLFFLSMVLNKEEIQTLCYQNNSTKVEAILQHETTNQDIKDSIWCLYFILVAPNLLALLNCLFVCLNGYKTPKVLTLITVSCFNDSLTSKLWYR
jgi:hypothetical protein